MPQINQDGVIQIGTLRAMAKIVLQCEDELQDVALADDNPYQQMLELCKCLLLTYANLDRCWQYEDGEEHNMLEDFAQRHFHERHFDEPDYHPWNQENRITTGAFKIGGTCNVNNVNHIINSTSSSGESECESDTSSEGCNVNNVECHFTDTSSEESGTSGDESDAGYEQDANAIHWDVNSQLYEDGYGRPLHTMTKQQLRDELLEIIRQRDAEEAQSRYTVTELDEPRPDTDEDRESDDSTDDYIPPPHTRCGEYGTEHCDCNHQRADWYHTPEDEWEGWAQRHNFEPYTHGTTRNVPASWHSQQ